APFVVLEVRSTWSSAFTDQQCPQKFWSILVNCSRSVTENSTLRKHPSERKPDLPRPRTELIARREHRDDEACCACRPEHQGIIGDEEQVHIGRCLCYRFSHEFTACAGAALFDVERSNLFPFEI